MIKPSCLLHESTIGRSGEHRTKGSPWQKALGRAAPPKIPRNSLDFPTGKRKKHAKHISKSTAVG